MILDDNSWIKLEHKMLNKYGIVPNNTKKQAMFPTGYQIIENHNGTANGFKLEFEKNRFISVFPGPPKECIPMLENLLLKSKINSDKKIIKKSWNIYGIGESILAEKLEQIKAEYSFVTFKYRIDNGFIELKYFYPRECPHSKSIITEVEHILASNIIKQI
jgi:molybdopterin-biosynthesis enzyme MoeA-like protein